MMLKMSLNIIPALYCAKMCKNLCLVLFIILKMVSLTDSTNKIIVLHVEDLNNISNLLMCWEVVKQIDSKIKHITMILELM